MTVAYREPTYTVDVSMKSGLEGRNNSGLKRLQTHCRTVSMKSGLEGRNN